MSAIPRASAWKGTNHSSRRAISAASPISGHGSPSVRWRKPSRSRNCDASLEKGRTASPSSQTPCANALTTASPAGRGNGVSSKTMAPSRVARRALTCRLALSKTHCSSVTISPGRCASTSAREISAAARIRACAARPVRSAMTSIGAAGEPFGLGDLRAAAVRHDEASAPAALEGDAVGKGVKQQLAGKHGRAAVLALSARGRREPTGQPPGGLGALASLRLETAQPIFEIDASCRRAPAPSAAPPEALLPAPGRNRLRRSPWRQAAAAGQVPASAARVPSGCLADRARRVGQATRVLRQAWLPGAGR